MTYDADPACLQGAVAAGILGCGSVILGTADLCGKLLIEAQKRVDAGATPEAAVLAVTREIHSNNGKIPGFGHNIHKPLDPRAERVLELARQQGVAGKYIALSELFRKAIAEVWGRQMPMNVSMAPASSDSANPVASKTGKSGWRRRISRPRSAPVIPGMA